MQYFYKFDHLGGQLYLLGVVKQDGRYVRSHSIIMPYQDGESEKFCLKTKLAAVEKAEQDLRKEFTDIEMCSE